MFEELRKNLDIRKFYNTKAETEINSGILDKNTLTIITIAFNSPQLFELQSKFLKKFIDCKFHYVIVDNSSNSKASKRIEDYCTKSKITYLKIPKTVYRDLDGSTSHGYALNWAYAQVVRRYRIKKFGFIDHDLYPIKKMNLDKVLDTYPIWGRKQYRGDRWYVWPGLFFIDRRKIKKVKLNFLPDIGLDTGGSNWLIFFHKYKKEKIPAMKHRVKYFRKTDGSKQNDAVEYIGDWLHIINTSKWQKGQSKTAYTKSLLNKIFNAVS